MDSLAHDLFQTETLTERAYRALEEDIVTLRIPPGTVVSEAILSRRLGVGRTPVREALQRLAHEWLVVVMPRRGVVVSEIDPIRQIRLLEARREIERFLARSAARLANLDQRAELRQIAEEMHVAADRADDIAFMRLDRVYNDAILDAANNEFAAASMSRMNGLSRRFWYMHYKTAADLPLTARLHASVALAVAEADADGAGVASDNLVDYILSFARSTIG